MKVINAIVIPIGVLLLAIQLMVASGCSSKEHLTSSIAMLDQYREAIIAEVDDAGRRTKVLIIVDDLKAELAIWKAGNENYRKELKALNADYDSTEAELRAHIETWNSTRSEFRQKVYKARDEALRVLTRDEWEAISDREASFVEVWLRENAALKSITP